MIFNAKASIIRVLSRLDGKIAVYGDGKLDGDLRQIVGWNGGDCQFQYFYGYINLCYAMLFIIYEILFNS
jgi:hypothetical protein